MLLDRPQITPRSGLTPQEIPRIEGEVLVGPDIVALETYDDGRLDRLIDRFVARAGLNIPPAHPRTKVIGKEPRYLLSLSCRWRIPAGVSEEDADRLNQEQVASHDRGRLAQDAATLTCADERPSRPPKAGDAETALRAAVRILEYTDEEWVELIDWSGSARNFSSSRSRPSIPIWRRSPLAAPVPTVVDPDREARRRPGLARFTTGPSSGDSAR